MSIPCVSGASVGSASTRSVYRKLLKRGSFRSREEVQQKVLAFIAYYNQAMAKPFKWTYKGRPLKI